MPSRQISRRSLLRGAGIALALPILDAMAPFVRADPREKKMRRIVCFSSGLGFHRPCWLPEGTGRDYKPSPYLDVLKEYRNDFTVFSGLSHADVEPSHAAEKSFLTAAPRPSGASFKNTISLDQLAAEKLGASTRYPYLALGRRSSTSLSWTRNGVPIPCEGEASRLYAKLFLNGTPAEVSSQIRRIRGGRSILDGVRDEAQRLQGTLGTRDRARIDEYFTSVRELEQRMVENEAWAQKPKPKVDVPPPKDAPEPDEIGNLRLQFDLAHLALKTDSTRIITLKTGSYPSNANSKLPLPGISGGWHQLTHHTGPGDVDQLKSIELEIMNAFANFLGKLKGTTEEDETLLQRTMVLMGSSISSGSNHDVKNLPVLLAGGGFKHGQHLAFDRVKNAPLCNLYVSMAQQLGLEVDAFGASTGTLNGLEMSR